MRCKIRSGGTALGPINNALQRAQWVYRNVFDDKTVGIEFILKVRLSACAYGATQNIAKVSVGWRATDCNLTFNLKAERAMQTSVVEFDYYVIHGAAVSGLLNCNRLDNTVQRCSAFFPEKCGKIIGNDCVFVRETSATGQLC